MPSHILTATIQSGVLSAISNLLAQGLTAWRAGTPLSINFVSLLQFVTYSVLSCPPNCLWQAWLESQFPAYPLDTDTATVRESTEEKPTVHSTAIASDGSLHRRVDRKQDNIHATSGLTTSTTRAKSLSKKNTAIKFTLDQTIGAGINTVLFISGIALLRGQDLQTIPSDVRNKFWPMTMAGQKLWPAVSILSFTVIPLEQRMLFGSFAGLIWGVYLSLAAGASKS